VVFPLATSLALAVVVVRDAVAVAARDSSSADSRLILWPLEAMAADVNNQRRFVNRSTHCAEPAEGADHSNRASNSNHDVTTTEAVDAAVAAASDSSSRREEEDAASNSSVRYEAFTVNDIF
jgi:hypothetical protein